MMLDNYHRAARMTYDFHISLFNKLVRPAEAGGSGLIDFLAHRGDGGLVKSVLFYFFIQQDKGFESARISHLEIQSRSLHRIMKLVLCGHYLSV